MLLGFKHFPLAFMLLSSYSELSLPHPVFICEAEMKTICSLQPPTSDLLPAHVLLFCFDLVAISSYRELHKLQSHMLGLGQVVSQMGAEPHCL